jgi:hypothetical protein
MKKFGLYAAAPRDASGARRSICSPRRSGDGWARREGAAVRLPSPKTVTALSTERGDTLSIFAASARETASVCKFADRYVAPPRLVACWQALPPPSRWLSSRWHRWMLASMNRLVTGPMNQHSSYRSFSMLLRSMRSAPRGPSAEKFRQACCAPRGSDIVRMA